MTEVPSMTDVPAPPYDDGDDEPEFRPRPRRRAHALTFVLAGALLIGAGFYGGVLLQKHEDHGSTSASAALSGRARLPRRRRSQWRQRGHGSQWSERRHGSGGAAVVEVASAASGAADSAAVPEAARPSPGRSSSSTARTST